MQKDEYLVINEIIDTVLSFSPPYASHTEHSGSAYVLTFLAIQKIIEDYRSKIADRCAVEAEHYTSDKFPMPVYAQKVMVEYIRRLK